MSKFCLLGVVNDYSFISCSAIIIVIVVICFICANSARKQINNRTDQDSKALDSATTAALRTIHQWF